MSAQLRRDIRWSVRVEVRPRVNPVESLHQRMRSRTYPWKNVFGKVSRVYSTPLREGTELEGGKRRNAANTGNVRGGAVIL